MLIAMGRNKATYLGMRISKVIDPEFGGLISGSTNYGDKSNRIEIPHGEVRKDPKL